MKSTFDMLDEFFKPDITIKVHGDNSIIHAMQANTKLGAEFLLLHHNILEKSYDEISEHSGICFEIVEEN